MKYSADDLSRFWSKVDTSGECWPWTAGTSTAGYGAFWHGGQMQKAHRVSYELEHGTIRADRFVDHVCHNRRCVRPAHLREVTNKQNVENHNGGPKVTSKSGVRGVVWVKDCNKWGVLVELIEARAEHIREVTAAIQLGKYAEGYKDGMKDAMEGVEVVYVGADDDEDED